MYAIQDKISCNYLSELSFQKIENDNWMYITYTGLIGPTFCDSRQEAEKILDILLLLNIESKFNRKLHITEVNLNNLHKGKQITKYLYNNMFKDVDISI